MGANNLIRVYLEHCLCTLQSIKWMGNTNKEIKQAY